MALGITGLIIQTTTTAVVEIAEAVSYEVIICFLVFFSLLS